MDRTFHRVLEVAVILDDRRLYDPLSEDFSQEERCIMPFAFQYPELSIES